MLGDDIPLFRSIIIFCGTSSIPWNIPSFSLNMRIFCGMLSVPHNIVMDLNNVMDWDMGHKKT